MLEKKQIRPTINMNKKNKSLEKKIERESGGL